MASSKREFDIAVLGASGFTGSLVVRHIAESYANSDLKFALAGRNLPKLQKVVDDLAAEVGPAFKERVTLVQADVQDTASLDALTSRASALITTAGPFSMYGTPVVASAVKNGTNYADITAEMPWVNQMIDRFHEEAEKKEIKLVSMCGYDSIPSDAGTYFACSEMQKKYGPTFRVDQVAMGVGTGKGGFSGGTIESGFSLTRQFSAEEIRRSQHPFYLNPGSSAPSGVADLAPHSDIGLPRWVEGLGAYLSPFIMSPINSRVVRRSQALLGFPFGDGLVYQEGLLLPSLVAASLVSGVSAGLGALFSLKPLHPLIRKYLPMPGEGPTREVQTTGSWTMSIFAKGRDATGAVRTGMFKVSDRRDPGYWSTSRMLLESGIVLARQAEEANQVPGVKKGGVLTPMAAMGPVLIERLKKAGIVFAVERLD